MTCSKVIDSRMLLRAQGSTIYAVYPLEGSNVLDPSFPSRIVASTIWLLTLEHVW